MEINLEIYLCIPEIYGVTSELPNSPHACCRLLSIVWCLPLKLRFPFSRRSTLCALISPFTPNACQLPSLVFPRLFYNLPAYVNTPGTVNKKHLLHFLHLCVFCHRVRSFSLTTALQWFVSYPSNRLQFVHGNGESSSHTKVKYGVPQGSYAGTNSFCIIRAYLRQYY